MILQDAIKSGRKIRNLRMKFLGWATYTDNYAFVLPEILDDSWETEPIKKEISREDLAKAWEVLGIIYPMISTFHKGVFDTFCKELGL